MEAQTQRTARRFRASSRVQAQQGCGCGGTKTRQVIPANQDQLISLKNGNLYLDQVAMTEEAAPGGSVFVDARVSNGALNILLDPDECEDDANPCTRGIFDLSLGYCYNLTISPQWTDAKDTGPSCVNLTEIGVGSKDHEFSFTAPQDTGTYTVQFTLEALGSGQRGTHVEEVVVTDVPSEDQPDTGNGGGNGNGGGPDLATIALLGLLAVGGAVAVSQR